MCVEKVWTSLLLAALTMAPAGCGALAPTSALSPSEGASGPSLDPLVRRWFSSLEVVPPEASAIDGFLADSPFDFELSEGGDPSPVELRSWLAALRTSHPRVEYEIGEIRTEGADAAEVRVRFQVDRRALDRAGVSHLARAEHTWLVRVIPGLDPAIRRIEERRLLAFPGTGPQIVCY